MIVKWNQDRLKVIPLAGCRKALKHYRRSELVMTPGFNKIPDDVWDELKERFSNIRNLLKIPKGLEEVDAVKTEKKLAVKDGKGKKVDEVDKTEGTPFNKLSAAKAKKIIKDTWKIETLEEFAKDESRADIRNLAQDKIKAIKERKI